MPSKKRNRSTFNDNDENLPPSKRSRKSPKSQRSQRSTQIAGIDCSSQNVFWDLLKQCKVRFRQNTTKPVELDSPESIEYYLQRKLMRDPQRTDQFINKFEIFMELTDGDRLKQCLLATVPRKNNRSSFISEAWKNMSQINESDISTISIRLQPSLIRILLNVDCLQQRVKDFLMDKLDEYITDENEMELVLQILEQFKFLDHLLGNPQQFTQKLFDLLEIGAPLKTQISIINLFDEIIHDSEHEFVALKLKQLLERNTNLTEAIVDCLSQLKISQDLKKNVEAFLLESLETSNVRDLDIIIRYLLRTVDADDVLEVITEMRQHIPFDTQHNNKILQAFKQCIAIQKHVPIAVLNVIINCNKNKLCNIDLWLLFILYHKGRLVHKIESLIIKKIEQQHITIKYITKSVSPKENRECLIDVFNAVLYLSQTMLESKNKCVSRCGAALYKLLYVAMNEHKYQHQLISSITSQIGSGTSIEVTNSLHLLLDLTKENKSVKLYQTPILILIDYIESFSNSQIRLLYRIFSLLSIHIDSNNQLQIANNLNNLITKQLAHSGFIHQQQAGIIGCIQLIHSISTKVAITADNAAEEACNLVQKLIRNGHNAQLFATMCDEFSLMIENSRNYNDKVLPWSQYKDSLKNDRGDDSDDDDDDIKMNNKDDSSGFYPIHRTVIQTLRDETSNMISESWCIQVNDGSQCMNTQQSQFMRNGLKPQMWLNLSAKRMNIHRNNAGMDSEATEYTDNDNDLCKSDTYISITPFFLAQSSAQIMWIFSPLFRLFGLLNATDGVLERIDSFLSAPLLMFNDEDLETAQLIDKSKVTRQIMGDSLFSAINCIRELLNVFCAEYVEFCRNEDNESHSRRNKIEIRLCHRLDHLVCLEYALDKFMRISLNKQFLPSFIPSQNKEKTWLNSPPWKRKMLFDEKKQNKKGNDDSQSNNDPIMSSADEDNDNHNKKKKKKKKKKNVPKVQSENKKKKSKTPSKSKTKTKDRSPLGRVEPYFRGLDLSVAVLLKFEILDRNYYKRASKRLKDLSPHNRHFSNMISLRAFHKLLKDFCWKTIEICNNQSARKGFANKDIPENISDYTPIMLIKRYGFIFAHITKQIHELITFRQKIHDSLDDDDTTDEDQCAYFRTLPPLIQDCFSIFIECITKLFKYKQFELAANRKIFDTNLLSGLCIDCDDSTSFTKMAINVIKIIEKICDYVEDINIAVNILILMELIMKNSRFDKNIRIDYKVKITCICDKMLKGNIGEGYIGQIKNASNIGQIVSIYLKNCHDDTRCLQMVAEWYQAFNHIEDHDVNVWNALLRKKTMIHFMKPILECITNAYSSAKIQDDIQLKFHIKCISHFQELVVLIKTLDIPKTSGYLMNYAAVILSKCIAKIPKMKQFHSSQHLVNHFDRVESVCRRLQRMIGSIEEKTGSFQSESVNKQWIKVLDQTSKLKKYLEEFMLKAKTCVHEAGLGHCLEIRSIKKQFGRKTENKDDSEEEEEQDEDDSEEEEEHSQNDDDSEEDSD